MGPHRDDLVLNLGDQPAKGFASHGETWSYAIALRLAEFNLLRQEGGSDPVLILDDVFAELDAKRRKQLVHLAAEAEQVLITAAVDEDLPGNLEPIVRYRVSVEDTETGRISKLSAEEGEGMSEDQGGVGKQRIDPVTQYFKLVRSTSKTRRS